MTITINTEKLAKHGSVGLAIAGFTMLCVGICAKKKGDKAIKNAEKAITNTEKMIEKLANTDPDQLTEEVIREAAKGVVGQATSQAIARVREDIGAKVSCSVNRLYENVEDEVAERYMKAVNREIDTDDVRRSVIQKASVMVAERCARDVKDCINPIKTMIKTAAEKD